MPAEIALGLAALFIVLAWLWLNWKVVGVVANLIALPFARAGDHEIESYEGESIGGQVTLRPRTRADNRVRTIAAGAVLPVVLWLNHRYWERIWGLFEWGFEDHVAPAILALFYGGGG